MPIDLLQAIILEADADTPATYLPYAGRVVLIHPEDMPGMGSGPTDPGKLLGILGYPNGVNAQGMTRYLMTPALDQVTKDFIDSIPLPKVWLDTTKRNVYRTVARQLIRDYGVPAADVRTALKALYDAAVANDRLSP